MEINMIGAQLYWPIFNCWSFLWLQNKKLDDEADKLQQACDDQPLYGNNSVVKTM